MKSGKVVRKYLLPDEISRLDLPKREKSLACRTRRIYKDAQVCIVNSFSSNKLTR